MWLDVRQQQQQQQQQQQKQTADEGRRLQHPIL
jgi:hypothetical protein